MMILTFFLHYTALVSAHWWAGAGNRGDFLKYFAHFINYLSVTSKEREGEIDVQ